MKTKQFAFIMFFYLLCMHASADDGVAYRDVTTTGYGQLEGLLGEDITTIDSLVVRGPINKADFTTMWKGCWYGKLQVINLEHAAVENNRIPDEAFRNADEQLYDPNHGGSWWPLEKLRRVILPEGITEIGNYAFFWVTGLKDIILPASVRKIGDGAFFATSLLHSAENWLPENLEIIGENAFDNSDLSGNLRLPSNVRKIERGTFSYSKIESVEIENLDSLCGFAFANCKYLKKVTLPKSGVTFVDGKQFVASSFEELILPETLQLFPSGSAQNASL